MKSHRIPKNIIFCRISHFNAPTTNNINVYLKIRYKQIRTSVFLGGLTNSGHICNISVNCDKKSMFIPFVICYNDYVNTTLNFVHYNGIEFNNTITYKQEAKRR